MTKEYPVMASATEPEVSVIIPVGSRTSPLSELYREYRAALDRLDVSFEIIVVLDGPNPDIEVELRDLLAKGEQLSVISLSKSFGESTAIMAGMKHSDGRLILTLPAYHQIDAGEICKVINSIDSHDMVVGRRWPRYGNAFDRLRRSSFHALLAAITGLTFRDLGCGVRCFDRRVLEEIPLYGEQHRYLAVLADRQGFRVRELDVQQSPRDRYDRGYKLREYVRSVLDLATVFFLTRFTKRPLRFFGTSGALVSSIGAVIVLWLVFERLAYGSPLAERPALILSSLMVVLGLQLFALGLLGELIIFTHSRELRDFQIERIIKFGEN